MAEIEMVSGSGFHIDKTKESEIQHSGGGGDIETFGGSNFHSLYNWQKFIEWSLGVSLCRRLS